MDNHQIELYEAIVSRNYAWGCLHENEVVAKLKEILWKGEKVEGLVVYPEPNQDALQEILDDVLEGKKKEHLKID